MNSNSAEDDCLSSRSLDETESPRKRMRLDSSTRKGWSLMDRKTDQEVLQEMGVSLLDPDDSESHCDAASATSSLHHKPLKRKHDKDIENVNPNVNSSSPRGKFSPRGKVLSPGAGPSKRSPRSTEKLKPLQPSDQHLLETTFLEEYLIEEETPLGQSVSLQSLPCGLPCRGAKQATTPKSEALGQEEEQLISRRCRSQPSGPDAFAVLSDEMLLSVMRWLPKRTLAHCMLVCKRWYRLACDETLWQRLDLGNKTLSKDALGRILARKPVIVRLASSEIGEWHPGAPPAASRIQFLDLSMATTDPRTLRQLLLRCPQLKKLSLESVALDDSICDVIGKCRNLETLNLTMAQGITAEGLTSILDGCTGLSSLNISWCSLCEASLRALGGLPDTLLRLNVAGARVLTDDMVIQLVDRCPRLLELDLSDCSRLGELAVRAVLTLTRLEHLALSRCYLLPPHVLTKVSCMPALQYLEVWGMLQTASLNALRAALPAIHVNQFMFSAIARPTVGTRRTSIWGLRTRD